MAHQTSSPSNNSTFSVNMDTTTRERISKLALERKRTAKSKHDRKTAIFASMETVGDDEEFIPPSREKPEPVSPKKNKKRSKGAQGSTRKRDDLSVSEHVARPETAIENKQVSADQLMKPRTSDASISVQSIDAKKVEKKRGGARSSSGKESPTRRERSGRSKSPHAMKRRTASPAAMKKERSSRKQRSSSLGPLKKERSKRSSSTGPLRSPMSPTKRKAPPILQKSMSSRDHRTLDQKLNGLNPPSPSKKRGGRSVASAPAVAKKQNSRRPRRKSTGPLSSSRRNRTADDQEPLIAGDSPRRRAKSADQQEMSIGDIGELLLNDEKDKPKSRGKNFSQRLSNGLRSFSKLAGFGGSGRSLAYNHHDSDGSEKTEDPPEQRPKSRKARGSSRSNVPAKRSNSAGPLGNRPRRDDRRAGLSRSKRNACAEDEEGPPQTRAQSMMLHREETRRGKANSLMDLRQYKEEEIHSTSYFASNHVLVNRERMKRGLRPLTRNIAMDELARSTAQKMSETKGKTPLPATYVGNVLRGESIRSIHRATMQNKEGRERHNLLSPYYQDFGVGTAKGEDGMLYICQLFSERIELTVTDTTA